MSILYGTSVTKTMFSNVLLLGAVLEGLGPVLESLGDVLVRLVSILGRWWGRLRTRVERSFDILDRLGGDPRSFFRSGISF